MAKIIYLICLLSLLCGNPSYAGKTDLVEQQSLDDLKKEIAHAEETVQKIDKEIFDTKEKIKKIRAEIKNSSSDNKKSIKLFNQQIEQQNLLQQARKRLLVARRNHSDLSLKPRYLYMPTSPTSKNIKLPATQGDLAKMFAHLHTDMKAAETLQKMRNSKQDLESLETALNDLEDTYDQSLMGIYMQDKFGRLLNSKVFCTAVNRRCGVAKKRPIKAEELKEIFPKLDEKWNARSGESQWQRGKNRKKSNGSR